MVRISQTIYAIEIKEKGCSCGYHKRPCNRSWVRNDLKNIFLVSWIINEINTEKHKYV